MSKSLFSSTRIIRTLIYLHWTSPLSYILILTALYNLPIEKAASIFFSFYYVGRSCMMLIIGNALRQNYSWSWYLYLLNAVLMVLEQFYIAIAIAENHTPALSLLVALLFIAIGVGLLKYELRVPYYCPKTLWWESDPRYKINIPITIITSNKKYTGQVIDINTSGCFVKMSTHLPLKKIVHLDFSIFNKKFHYDGRIVWIAPKSFTCPEGIGIRFVNVEKESYTPLKEEIKRLRQSLKTLRKKRREEKVFQIEKKVKARSKEK